jgi:hypothetical protein
MSKKLGIEADGSIYWENKKIVSEFLTVHRKRSKLMTGF